MQVLVTGARGLLGRDVTQVFSQKHDVTAYGRQELDVTDLPGVMAAVKQLRPDLVVHCASLTRVDECEGDPDAAMIQNALATRNVAAACDAVGAAMMYMSTDYVFDGRKKTPYTEYEALNPINAYGRSKAEGERLAAACCNRLYIVRTSWLYGLGGSNFVTTILAKARRGETLHVVDDQWGSPTYSMDLAEAMLAIAETGAYGTYHMTNADSTNWYAFTHLILQWSGVSVDLKPQSTDQLARPAKRPLNSRLSNWYGKLQGIPEMRSYRDALAVFLKLV